MYLWRNLPEGHLLAVLRWFQARRESSRPAVAIKIEGARPAEAAAPEPR